MCANFGKTIFFLWLTPLLKRCYRSDADITAHDLPDSPFASTKNTSKIFQANCKKYNGKTKRLFILLFMTSCVPYSVTIVLELCALVFQFFRPYFLSKLIGLVSDDDQCLWYGLFYAIAYCLLTQMKGVVRCNANHLSLVVEERTKMALTTALYSKMLRLSPGSRKTYATGDISSMIGEDVYQIASLFRNSYNLVTIPLTLCVSLCILCSLLGKASQTLIVVILVVGPIIMHVFNRLSQVEIKHLELKDKRLRQLCEMFNNIKLVKLLGWEVLFFNRIRATRTEELKQQNENNIYWSIIEMITMTVPMLTASLSFLVFTITSDQALTANTAFICLTIYNLLRMPLASFPRLITLLSTAMVSYQRIIEYLSAEEHNPQFVENNTSNNIVELNDCSFNYDLNEKPVLKNINLTLEKGSLYMVIGRTGSGKSSLLSALLGDMYRTDGSHSELNGSVAYVPQTAWIQNTSLRQNIVFLSKYNKSRLRKIIRACALEPDLNTLPARDLTPIGRRGVSLSGGQNHRVSLARAVYQEADIYLLDDPLSAVDAHVAQHLFHNVIGPKGLLAEKTRVVVTHNLQFAKYADYIVVMDNGSIVECGGYEELVNKGIVIELMRKVSNQKTNEQVMNNSIKSNFEKSDHNNSEVKMNNLVKRIISMQDEQHCGSNRLKLYHNYIIKCDPMLTIAALIAIIVFNGSEVIGNYLLNIFTSVIENSDDRTKILWLYMLTVILNAFFCILSQLVFRKGAIRGAALMHDRMLMRVIRAPMTFFSRTPLGQIISRFSLDINHIDDQIPSDLLEAATNLIWLACVFFFIIYNQCWLIILVGIVIILFIFLNKIYLRTSRQLHRLVGQSRPPIYSHLNESMFGIASVRAYKAQSIFVKRFQNVIENNIKVNRILNATINWNNLWTALIGSAITLSTALLVVFNRQHITPGLVGFVLSYSIEMTNCVSMAFRMAAQLDGQMVSIERINEYSHLEQEGVLESGCHHQIEPGWPSSGSIEFIGYSTSYGQGFKPVLKNINLKIRSGEKLGIVGRTGAGKSSLAMALMRLIEPTSGRILIDGLDISDIGLHDLRTNVSIISQEPTLFAGTLRFNLDPFNEFSDLQLWSALEYSHLKNFLDNTSEGLLFEISENGSNLSGGQRQLVCLARAMLRRTKILVLDEASAACDAITDKLIRSTIQDKFKDCTVLTIAHRLDTVLDYNSVVVLNEGLIVEYDSPKNLLNKSDSIFYGLAKEYGIV